MADDFLATLGVQDPTEKKAGKAPAPLDAALRTVYAESSGDPAESAWIAGVIANRAKTSGKSLAEVVQEAGQFEPWGSKKGRDRMAALDPASEQYQKLAAEIGPILQGQKPDPTGGAMHFYAPDAQAQLGRPKPDFDTGAGVKVGQTLFFGGGSEAPDGFLSSIGVDAEAAAKAASSDGGEVNFDAAHPKMTKYAELKPEDQKAYHVLYEGGLLDPDAPYGSQHNPFFSTDPKQLPAGAFYVEKGAVKRTPGGPKDSSFMAGLGQGAADVATSISHVVPGSDDSPIKNTLIGSQMLYGPKYGGDFKSGAGRFTGQVVTSAPLLAGAAEAAAPVVAAASPEAASFLGGSAGAWKGASAAQKALRVASLAAAGGNAGAGAAALTSSANREPLGEQIAGGYAGGALLGPVGPALGAAGRGAGRGVKAMLAPLSHEGREGIVNRVVDQFGDTGNMDLSIKVPGSEPTMGEAAGNAGLSILEKQMRAHPRTAQAFEGRLAQNSEARSNLFDALRGDSDTISNLQLARDQATAGARDAALKAQTQPADVAPILKFIDDTLKGPEGKRAEVVKALTAVRNNLHDATGTPETSAEILYGVRKDIGDLLDPRASSDRRGAQVAVKELKDVQRELDKVIEGVAPGFKKYLSDYADLSKPINEQTFLQGLKIADAKGNITLARAQSALDKINTMRKQSGANDAKSISQNTYDSLVALRDDLKRAGNIDLGKPRGSDSIQNLVTGNIAAESGIPISVAAGLTKHPKVAAAVGLGKLFYGAKEKQVLDQLAERLLNPSAQGALPATPVAPANKLTGGAKRVLKQLPSATAGLLANRIVSAQ